MLFRPYARNERYLKLKRRGRHPDAAGETAARHDPPLAGGHQGVRHGTPPAAPEKGASYPGADDSGAAGAKPPRYGYPQGFDSLADAALALARAKLML